MTASAVSQVVKFRVVTNSQAAEQEEGEEFPLKEESDKELGYQF
ncbi:MAG TPA: hypothetical protein VK203_29425 [Nostocaceae cyanobacterium]|nr:hypothetical protein [Nostocaceae cyanobacterium]